MDDVRHQIEPILELVEQPRLADSRLAHDRHHPRHRACGNLVILTFEDAELCVSADHPCLDAFDPARRHPERSGLRGVNDVDAYRFRLALDVNRAQGSDVEDAADVPVGVVRDENTADRCRLLQAGREVDGVTHRRELAGRADRAEQHGAGGDSDAHPDAVARLVTESRNLPLQLESSANGALRVALARRVRAPQRHDRIADVLVDVSTMLTQHGVEPPPHLVDDLRDDLNVERLGERREAADVGEEHRRLTPPLTRAADRSQPLAQRRESDFDRIVTDRLA